MVAIIAAVTGVIVLYGRQMLHKWNSLRGYQQEEGNFLPMSHEVTQEEEEQQL